MEIIRLLIRNLMEWKNIFSTVSTNPSFVSVSVINLHQWFGKKSTKASGMNRMAL